MLTKKKQANKKKGLRKETSSMLFTKLMGRGEKEGGVFFFPSSMATLVSLTTKYERNDATGDDQMADLKNGVGISNEAANSSHSSH